MNDPRWPARPLSDDERTVLRLLLSADFEGAAELRVQSESAMSEGGCGCGCPSVQLLVTDEAAPLALLQERLVPVELEVAPDEDGIPGEVILFVDDGRLSYLEYVSYTPASPTTWPEPSRLSIRRSKG